MNNFNFWAGYWYNHQLCNSVAWLDGVGVSFIISQSNTQRTTVIRVNHTNIIGQRNPVSHPHTAPHSYNPHIVLWYSHCDTGWNDYLRTG